jgi:hypothetical protein
MGHGLQIRVILQRGGKSRVSFSKIPGASSAWRARAGIAAGF